jgi:hypothetical protein
MITRRRPGRGGLNLYSLNLIDRMGSQIFPCGSIGGGGVSVHKVIFLQVFFNKSKGVLHEYEKK